MSNSEKNEGVNKTGINCLISINLTLLINPYK